MAQRRTARVLFDLATSRLVERKILLPGVTTLTRLVAAIRDRAALWLWRRLAQLPDTGVRQHLESLLVIPAGGRQTPLDRLRTAPVRATAPALVAALRRLDEVRAIGAGRLDFLGLASGSREGSGSLRRGRADPRDRAHA